MSDDQQPGDSESLTDGAAVSQSSEDTPNTPEQTDCAAASDFTDGGTPKETATPEDTAEDDAGAAEVETVDADDAVPGPVPDAAIHAFDADDIDLTEVESQLQALVPAVIEMTEHVTQTSEVNKEFRGELEQERTLTSKAIKQYQAMLDKQKKTMTIVLSASIAVLLIGCGVIGITAASYSKQSNNMNAMSLALGKRIGEVSSGLATFEQINQSLATMQQTIERLQLDSELMRSEYATFKTENQSLLDDSLSSLNDNFVAQTQALSDRIGMAETEYQSTKDSLTEASEAISGLRGRVDNASSKADQLLSLQEALDALVVLERERYLEQLRAQLQQPSDTTETVDNEAQPDESLIQYSRPGSDDDISEYRR
ncbi:MAG: hypothetical protein PsegKO_25460 [Pseudohongiellaceae bacterium]